MEPDGKGDRVPGAKLAQSFLSGGVQSPRHDYHRPRVDTTLSTEKACGNSRSEIMARHLSKPCRFAYRPRDFRLEKPRPIGFQHDGVKRDGARVEARGAVENPQKGTLRRKGYPRRRIENRRQERLRTRSRRMLLKRA